MERTALYLEILAFFTDTVLNGTLSCLLWEGAKWCVKQSEIEIWLLEGYILVETG